MDIRPPSHFHEDLTDDRLRVIAEALLEVRYSTIRELNSPWDDNYTREATVFGRQRNRLIDMCLQPAPSWLTLGHAGMDLTFYIGNVPCRFFTEDNPDAPKKEGFFRRNAVDNLFTTEEADPVLWRFVLERNPVDPLGDRVFFIGFNVFQDAVAMWEYRSSGPILHSVDDETPRAVDIPAARIEPKDDDKDEASKPDAAGA